MTSPEGPFGRVGRALIVLDTLVLPRLPEELAAQEALFPAAATIPFGPDEGRIAARLHRDLPRSRGREIDLAIAACALVWKASLWTLNEEDFAQAPS